jgi:hypothetical protein
MVMMSSALKDEVRALVDEIPESELNAARRYLEYLRDVGEELTAEELARLDADIATSLAEARAGKTHAAEDVIAHLRALP